MTDDIYDVEDVRWSPPLANNAINAHYDSKLPGPEYTDCGDSD